MNPSTVEALIPELFAPWVQSLSLSVLELTETGGQFVMPANPDLVRSGGTGGGVVCGQALAAAADTVSVLALSHLNNRFRACTTTDINIRFMRPLKEADIQLDVVALSNGRKMAVTEVVYLMPGTAKVCCKASCSFIYLEE